MPDEPKHPPEPPHPPHPPHPWPPQPDPLIHSAPLPPENVRCFIGPQAGEVTVCWQPSPSWNVTGYAVLWQRNGVQAGTVEAPSAPGKPIYESRWEEANQGAPLYVGDIVVGIITTMDTEHGLYSGPVYSAPLTVE